MNANQSSERLESARDKVNSTAGGAGNAVRDMVEDYKCGYRGGAKLGRGDEGSGCHGGTLTFDNIFSSLDTNHDGQLSKNEFSNLFQAVVDISNSRRPTPPDTPVGGPPDAHVPGGEVPPGKHPPDCHLPGRPPVPPPEAHIPGGEVPPGKHPPDAHVPGGEGPPGKHPPEAHIPGGEVPSGKPPVSQPDSRHNFSTHDGKIFDPNGKEFQPRGVDVDNLNYALQDVDKITGDWSANIIRVTPFSKKDGPISYDKELLGKVVDEYTKRGVVVEIDDGLANHWGDILNDQQIAAHADFYKQMATQFKDNPYVWFASPNEAGAVVKPNSADDKQWLKEELAVDKAIRDSGNNNMIVQGDTYWGQGATNGGDSALVRYADQFQKFGNVIAGQHVYNDRPDASDRLGNSIDALRDKGFAVVVDEVSSSLWAGGSAPVQDVSKGSDAVLNAVDEKGVGMLAFRWFEANKNLAYNLTVNGRGQGALTDWGKKVWHMTHED